jgi:hypothetical protein
MEYPIDESAWRHGWSDTKKAWKTWKFYVFDLLAGGLIGGFFEWYWGLAVVGFGMLCVWMSATTSAPLRQRDEARKLYEPIKELANIKPGDTIKEKVINVSLMFEQLDSTHLANVAFERCVLKGPCLITLEGDYVLHGCDVAGALGTTLFEREIGTKYYGVGVFVNCTFSFCEFANISFLLPEGEIKRFLSTTVQV